MLFRVRTVLVKDLKEFFVFVNKLSLRGGLPLNQAFELTTLNFSFLFLHTLI